MKLILESLMEWKEINGHQKSQIFRSSAHTLSDLEQVYDKDQLLKIRGSYVPSKPVICGYFSIHSDDFLNPFNSISNDPLLKVIHNSLNRTITSTKGEICYPLSLNEVLHLCKNTDYYVFSIEGMLVREGNISSIESLYRLKEDSYKNKTQQIS
ncbi:hypothetical protein ACFYKX_19030 [Cytobacillus sp. FJAT-54145]|uniref:Uncharacterized protein n=1 Tax=Cytobacillus spartinae TaxID=3299023 RepID=A0ABW6KG45_9BACI